MGLLLLRLAASSNSLLQGWLFLYASGNPAIETWILGLVWILLGVMLLIGFLMPATSSVAAIGGAAAALSIFPALPYSNLNDRAAAADFIIIALSLIVLGPGAYSLDARLFGRREIIIRDLPRPPRG